MSYPRDLDEIPEAQLEKELDRRMKRRVMEGVCDYCGRPPRDRDGKTTPACKFPERHSDPRINCR